MIILIMIAAGAGMARVGRSTGDHVRRQITADAAARSGARVLAQRLRHVGRMQDRGMFALRFFDKPSAEAAAKCAWLMTAMHPLAVSQEVDRVADENGATGASCISAWGLYGLFKPVKKRAWFFGPSVTFVGINKPLFRNYLLRVSIDQPSTDGRTRQANSSAWVETRGSLPEFIDNDDWLARLKRWP